MERAYQPFQTMDRTYEKVSFFSISDGYASTISTDIPHTFSASKRMHPSLPPNLSLSRFLSRQYTITRPSHKISINSDDKKKEEKYRIKREIQEYSRSQLPELPLLSQSLARSL